MNAKAAKKVRLGADRKAQAAVFGAPSPVEARLLDMVRKFKAREGHIVRGLGAVKTALDGGDKRRAEDVLTYLLATDLKDAVEAEGARDLTQALVLDFLALIASPDDCGHQQACECFGCRAREVRRQVRAAQEAPAGVRAS